MHVSVNWNKNNACEIFSHAGHFECLDINLFIPSLITATKNLMTVTVVCSRFIL